jgi:hypothetical protein
VVPDAKELKALEDENRLLKQMVATQALGIEALKAMVAKKMMTGRPPQAAGFLRGGTSSSATQACKHPRPHRRPKFDRGLPLFPQKLGSAFPRGQASTVDNPDGTRSVSVYLSTDASPDGPGPVGS